MKVISQKKRSSPSTRKKKAHLKDRIDEVMLKKVLTVDRSIEDKTGIRMVNENSRTNECSDHHKKPRRITNPLTLV